MTRPWPGHSASSTTYLSLSTSTYGPWLRRGASAGKGLVPGLTAVATHPSLRAGRMERLVWRVLRSGPDSVTYLNAIAGVITVGNTPDAQPFATSNHARRVGGLCGRRRGSSQRQGGLLGGTPMGGVRVGASEHAPASRGQFSEAPPRLARPLRNCCQDRSCGLSLMRRNYCHRRHPFRRDRWTVSIDGFDHCC